MKKGIVWLIVSVMLCLTACGNRNDAAGNSATEVRTESTDTELATEQGNLADTESKSTSEMKIETKNEVDTEGETEMTMYLTIGDTKLTAKLADNSSAEALVELLKEGPLTIAMSDYASMEKVGGIGTSLPTNNEQITTEAGDLILYMGNAFVIYYAPNSWNFTRLGKIQDVTAKELKEILGTGDVSVTLSLE